jgi:hypothetical protein
VWIGHPTEEPLDDFFSGLATEWRGWEGIKEWRTYEDGLALLAANDGRGHVTLTVELRQRSKDGWLVRGNVPLDAGQLERVARELERFWTP